MTAPETLLRELLGGGSPADEIVAALPPMYAPYDVLAVGGQWVVDPSRADADVGFLDGASGRDALVRSIFVALDYAVRRGATSIDEAAVVLARESPIHIKPSSTPVAAEHMLVLAATRLGLGAESLPAGERRRAGHLARLGRRHDPALSFQSHPADDWLGGNSLSSFVVHDEPERHGATVTGDVGDRWGVEVGVGGRPVGYDELVALEREIRVMPSFLDGISCRDEPSSLVAGWREGDAPSGDDLAGVIHAWTSALFDLPIVDVRVVFAPPRGRSAVLVDMRARAVEFRKIRDAALGDATGRQSSRHPEGD